MTSPAGPHVPAPHSQPAAPPQPGPAPGTDLSADLGAALRFTGRGLLRGAAAFLVPAVVHMVLLFLVIGGSFVALMAVVIAMVESSGGGEPGAVEVVVILLGSLVMIVLSSLVSMLWMSGAARVSAVLADGHRPTIRQGLAGPGRVIATSLVVTLLVVLGSILLYLPGIIAAVLTFYAIPAALRGASVGAALKESFTLVKQNLGITLLGYLIYSVAMSVASMTLIGALVVVPFGMLLMLGLYERLQGRELPDLAAA
ncbi:MULTISPECIES: hypothetical protein [unclassified Brachybacterium]|uniref:hypothetical protein n=1 Tax=unclassified Brachybacterium TaxID=2623841 RepID=UPI0011AEFFD1|nr:MULTISPECIES: hypothetical protein [unclassified Brachybacterium]